MLRIATSEHFPDGMADVMERFDWAMIIEANAALDAIEELGAIENRDSRPIRDI